MKKAIPLLFFGLLAGNVPAQEAAAPEEEVASEPPAEMVPTDWATRLRESRLGGLALELPGDPPLFALFEEERGSKDQGAIVLVHDNGRHPAWPAVIEPLRAGLPEHGWATLSIHVPAITEPPESGEMVELLDTTRTQLQAAIRFLTGRGYRNVVVAGHGMGAAMVTDFAAAAQDAEIVGVVLIGLRNFGATDEPRLDTPALLRNIRVSLLDLYGSKDHPDVVRAARSRVSAVQAGPLSTGQYARGGVTHFDIEPGEAVFRQIRFEGADHDFTGLAPELLKTVRGWLERHAAGMRITTNTAKPRGK